MGYCTFSILNFQDEAARTSRILGSYASATRHGRLTSRFASITGCSYPYPQARFDAECTWYRVPAFFAKQSPAICCVSLLRAFLIMHVSDSATSASSKMDLLRTRGTRAKGTPWIGSQAQNKRNGAWVLFRLHRPTSNYGMGPFPWVSPLRNSSVRASPPCLSRITN